MPALLAYSAQSSWHVVGFLVGFYGLFVGGLALQIILVGQAGKLSSQANGFVIAGAALLLVGFGLYMFWTGLTSLV